MPDPSGELKRSKSLQTMTGSLPRTSSATSMGSSAGPGLSRRRRKGEASAETKEKDRDRDRAKNKTESKFASESKHAPAREHKVGSESKRGGGGGTRRGPKLHIDSSPGRGRPASGSSSRPTSGTGSRPSSASKSTKKVLTPRTRIRSKMSLQLNFSKLNLNSNSGHEDLVAVSPMATGGRDSSTSRASHGPDTDETDSSFYTPRDDSGGRWMVGPDGIVEMPQSALDAIHSVVRPISAVDKSTASNARSKSDDFLRLRKLGGGAGGTVYLAIHKKHLQLVALKTIDYTKQETQQQRRQEVERELTILHPNFVPLGQPDLKPADYCDQLVSFHGAYTTERFITIILEFMPLGSLDDCLKRGIPVQDMALRLVARRVLQGLEYLHDRGVLHRDIKPGNILIGRKGKVKIADFGLAVKVQNYKQQNLNVSMKGTKQFMSFERLDHDLPPDEYSFASDVWSLGITIYCLAMGKKTPFEKLGNNHLSLREHLLTHSVIPDLRKHTAKSDELCDFVEKCLYKDPKRRPTVKQLLTMPFVDRSRIDISQVHFFVQPRTKRTPEKELSFIVEAIATSFTKDKQAADAARGRRRSTAALALPPVRKGSRATISDDDDDIMDDTELAAMESKQAGKADLSRRLSATAVLKSPTRERESASAAKRTSLPPVEPRGLQRSSTVRDLRTTASKHRPHTAEMSRQYFTKNRPFKGAIETLARQLDVPVVQAWSLFEAHMPGWAPRPTVRKERARFDASLLPTIGSGGRGPGNLAPLGKPRDRLSSGASNSGGSSKPIDFNRRAPLSMSTGGTGSLDLAGDGIGMGEVGALQRDLPHSTSLLDLKAVNGRRQSGDGGGGGGGGGGPDRRNNRKFGLEASAASFDDSFASTDPESVAEPLALSPHLNYRRAESDSSDEDSIEQYRSSGNSSFESSDEEEAVTFDEDQEDTLYM